MKRSTIAKSVIILLCAAACTSKIEVVEPATTGDAQKEEETVNVWSFTASTDPETKSAIGNDGKVVWKNGDGIVIRDVRGKYAVFTTNQDNVSTATFTTTEDPGFTGGPYRAYYPADIYEDGTLKLPVVQDYDGTGTNSPMFAVSTDNNLSFKNLCGIVKVNLTKAEATIARIRLESNEIMCGQFTVNGSNAASLSGGYKYIIMECGEDGVDISSGASFYIAIPAGTYTGFKIVLQTTDQMECVLEMNGTLTINRNSIQPITLGEDKISFVGGTFVTYFNKEGKILDPALEGGEDPCNFNFAAQNSGVTNFKLEFSKAQGNAINWDAGDVLEAKFAWANGNQTGALFSIGDGNGWHADNTINIITHTYNDVNYTNIATSTNSNKKGLASNATNIWVKFSKEFGLECSTDGLTWTQYTEGAAALADIKTRGMDTPLYVGAYCNNVSGSYEYLRVVRGYKPSEVIPVTGIELNHYGKTIYQGETLQLEATITPSNATYQDVVWTSDNPSVATVDETGLVYAVDAGFATVTATTVDGGLTAQCVVTVGQCVTDSNLGSVRYFCSHGHLKNDPYKIRVSSYDEGFHFSNSDINWRRGDEIEFKLSFGPNDSGILFMMGVDAYKEAYQNSQTLLFVEHETQYNNWSFCYAIGGHKYIYRAQGSSATFKMSIEGIWYSTDNGQTWSNQIWKTYTDQEMELIDQKFLDLLALDTYYFASHCDQAFPVSGTVDYIKWTVGDKLSDTIDSGNTNAGGNVNTNTTVSW